MAQDLEASQLLAVFPGLDQPADLADLLHYPQRLRHALLFPHPAEHVERGLVCRHCHDDYLDVARQELDVGQEIALPSALPVLADREGEIVSPALVRREVGVVHDEHDLLARGQGLRVHVEVVVVVLVAQDVDVDRLCHVRIVHVDHSDERVH